jgi:hypothetical protein
MRRNLITAGILLALWMAIDAVYVLMGQPTSAVWRNSLWTRSFFVLPFVVFTAVNWTVFARFDALRRVLAALATAVIATVTWYLAARVIIYFFHALIGGRD